MAASTSLTPEQRTERARNAALARTDPDTLIRRLVDRAPELTAEQRSRLAALLRPAVALTPAPAAGQKRERAA